MEKVMDHYNGNDVIRPRLNPRLKYDFDFRKKGADIWRYLNSCNDLDAFKLQSKTVIDNGGEYRIVDSSTGEVICQS